MMPHGNRWLVAMPLVVGLQMTACNRQAGTTDKIEPAHVEHIEGTELSRVTLTDRAMERVDVQLGAVHETRVMPSGRQRVAVPYSAVIYDVQGATWVYTSPAPNTFVRAPIEVDYIDGDLAILNDGPSVGTQVVTVGGGILHGTEFGVGH
jgi:hypothetical protein